MIGRASGGASSELESIASALEVPIVSLEIEPVLRWMHRTIPTAATMTATSMIIRVMASAWARAICPTT